MKANFVDLSSMLACGGSWHNIPGKDPSGFITAALIAMSEPGLPDRQYLTEAMLRREQASPTAMGDSLAFPHPLVNGIGILGKPFVAVAYPRFPVSWGAPDGVYVKAAFFVVCSDRHFHLLTLAALANHCSRNEIKVALLDEAPVSELIMLMASKSI